MIHKHTSKQVESQLVVQWKSWGENMKTRKKCNEREKRTMNERVSMDFPRLSICFLFRRGSSKMKCIPSVYFVWISGGWIDDIIVMICIMFPYLFCVGM